MEKDLITKTAEDFKAGKIELLPYPDFFTGKNIKYTTTIGTLRESILKLLPNDTKFEINPTKQSKKNS